jgi:invasion protein IalB
LTKEPKVRFLTTLIVVIALLMGGAAAAVYLGLVPGMGPAAPGASPEVTAAVLSPGVGTPASPPASSQVAPQTAQAVVPPIPGVQPAEVAPPAPQRQVVDRQLFGDWVYLCTADAARQDRACTLLQELSRTGTNEKLLSWRISVGPDGNLLSSWEVPTGLRLRAGFQLDYGGEKPIAIPYDMCTRGSCIAVAEFGDEFQQRLVTAPKVTGTIVNTANKGLAFTLSAKGLTEAVAALRASAPAVQPAAAQ